MTDQRVVVVTGAAGFLGSAITVDLASQYKVVAIDRRQPNDALRNAAASVEWHLVDIADARPLVRVFKDASRRHGRVDAILHFAAFYHFGSDWHPEYERSNLAGTSNVLRAAVDAGARRLIFASSLAAMPPSLPGELLTERGPTSEDTPYGRSKSLGERMIRETSGRLPFVILRIGGVFSDWCELPPLYSLIKLWAGTPPLNRLIVGQGRTGFPYIHRHDLVRLVRACLDQEGSLPPTEVFLAAQHGAVVHHELYPIVRSTGAPTECPKPFHVDARLVELALRVKVAWGWMTNHMPCERPWMLRYVDRPWMADTRHTRKTLNWHSTPELGILERLPLILERFHSNRGTWENRNRRRNALNYAYCPDGVAAKAE